MAVNVVAPHHAVSITTSTNHTKIMSFVASPGLWRPALFEMFKYWNFDLQVLGSLVFYNL